MFDKAKKQGISPNELINDEENKRIYNKHILKSIETTKKTVQKEDVKK